MPTKRKMLVAGITAFSLVVIAVLYALSEEPFSYRQNFLRIHRDNFVKQKHTCDLGNGSYYLAGVTHSANYFGDRTDSLALLVTDRRLRNLQHICLRIAGTEHTSLRDSRIEIDSPFFYIKAGAVPGIFKGELGKWQASRILDSITFFEQSVSLGTGSFVYQSEAGTAAHKARINILCKAMPQEEIVLKTDLLEGNVDNYYSTLGTLRYSKTLYQLVYTYTYRDEYIVMDTSLNLLYKANSIGTVTRAQIKPKETTKGNYTLASTSAIVNRGARVYDNLLFINSNLMAKNESREAFDLATVIDVYDLQAEKYRFSFYLPDYNTIKVTSFRPWKHGIVAVYNRHAVTYAFNDKSLTKTFTDR